MWGPLGTRLAVNKISRYLKGTYTYGMSLKRPSHLSLDGFFDADWAIDHDYLRSMT